MAQEDRRIALNVFQENGWLILEVHGHGPGIDPAFRKRLFKPFARSAHESAGRQGGIGLGLTLSRRLAQELGGDLNLKDLVDTHGCCFALRLPLGGVKTY